jgi:hypothetical protein
MKTSQLKSLIKEAVKEAIQEEMRDILLEAVKGEKQPVFEESTPKSKPIPTKSREEIREGYKNILGETAASFNSSMADKPLQINGPIDTTAPNGGLPEGNVSMDQIMGLMKGK